MFLPHCQQQFKLRRESKNRALKCMLLNLQAFRKSVKQFGEAIYRYTHGRSPFVSVTSMESTFYLTHTKQAAATLNRIVYLRRCQDL